MHDIVNFLKQAVDRAEAAGVYGCYIVQDGMIMARNAHIQAGFPMPSKMPFNIPADELDRSLGRMENIDKLVIKDGEVRMSSGRLRATIQVNTSPAAGMFIDMQDLHWHTVPEGFTDALRTALPFIGDRDFTESIQISTNRVGAVSGQRAVGLDLKGLIMNDPIMLTPQGARFLIEQDQPHEYHVTDKRNGLVVRWEDGRWAFLNLLTYNCPDDNIKKIFAEAGDDCPVIIDDEWRGAYEDAKALSYNGDISLTPDAILVKGKHSTAQVKYKTKGLPEGHQTYWDCKLLDAMVAAADRWNPAGYPRPCTFMGPNLKGVIMGMSRWRT